MIFLISDLHLHCPTATNSQCFQHFVERYRRKIEKLYILGDLFDYWIGDDIERPISDFFCQQMAKLAECGVKSYFMAGNRDFLLGKAFAKRAGMQILPDPTLLDLYGKPTLLLHGDTLCLHDPAYRRYRKIVHHSMVQRFFLALPRRLRQRIAESMRQTSQQHNQQQDQSLLDVDPLAVADLFKSYPVEQLIHGHTHRPYVHNLTGEHLGKKRIVLGAWHQQGNGLLCSPNGELELVYF